MKVSLSKADVIWSYIGTFLSLSGNILILPFVIYYLSGAMLGLWYIYTSIGIIAALFDFGFGVTFARNITYCWSGASQLKKENVEFADRKEPDYLMMKNVLETCRTIYLILSTTALILLFTAGTAYILHVARNIRGYSYLIAWAIYSSAIFLNLYYGYYASFLRGVGAVDQVNINMVISKAAQIMISVFLLVCGFGIIAPCAAYLVYGTVFRMLGKYKFYRYHGIGENLKRVAKEPDKKELRKLFGVIWHNAWRDGVVALSNFGCNEASTLICSFYLSLTQTGVYSLGVQLASAVAAISATLYTAYQPTIQSAYIGRDINTMRRSMSVIVIVFILMFILGMAAVIFIGLPILRWIKPEAAVTVPVLLGLGFYQFILKFRNCYGSYFSCTNRMTYYKAYLFSALLSIALSLLLIGPFGWGIWGLIVAQVLSQVIYNVWYWPMKAQKEMNLPFYKMFLLCCYELKSKGLRLKRGEV